MINASAADTTHQMIQRRGGLRLALETLQCLTILDQIFG
jgi:hypothetical protein